MAANEELVRDIRAGDRGKLILLWENVRRLVWQQARRWDGLGGFELEDLVQAGFIATLEAVRTFDPEAGAFSTWLYQHIRREFNEATGQHTQRQKRDPLQTAASLDAPLDEESETELWELIPDPAAEAAFLEVAERDRIERIRAVLGEALAELPEEQRRAVVGKYYCGRSVDSKAHAAALRRLRNPSWSRRLKECR